MVRSATGVHPFLSVFGSVHFSSLPVLHSLFFMVGQIVNYGSKVRGVSSMRLEFLSRVELTCYIGELFAEVSSLQ